MTSDLGVGVIYWPPLEPFLERHGALVDVVEVEPQTLWLDSPGGGPFRVEPSGLARITALPQPKLIHSVGFPVGGSRSPDPRNLMPLGTVAESLGAHWLSEHLSFNEACGAEGAFNTGFLLPPRQSKSGVAAAVASIRSMSTEVPIPFAVETGVSYLRPRRDELSDGAFVAAVVEEADCGLLLDLHNVYVNERNGRQSAVDFVAEIPLERVWEVHVAGGFELDGYWLDAHSGTIPAPLMGLAAEVIPQLPNLRALIFEVLPEYVPQLGIAGLRAQLEALHEVWESRGNHLRRRPARRVRPGRDGRAVNTEGPGPAEWEDCLGALAIGRTPNDSLSLELSHDPGVALLRKLVGQFRAGTVADTLRLTSRLLLLTRGPDEFRALLERFWATYPPEKLASAEALNFAHFLDLEGPTVPYLQDVLALEVGAISTRISDSSVSIRLARDPTDLVEALEMGHLPTAVEEGPFELTIEPASQDDPPEAESG